MILPLLAAFALGALVVLRLTTPEPDLASDTTAPPAKTTDNPAPVIAKRPPPPEPETEPELVRKPASEAVRPISPDRFAAPFAQSTDDLERIAARPPLSIPEPPKPIKKSEPLYRAVAMSAGELRTGGDTIRIAGIRPTPTDRACPSGNGSTWPCGMMARTALRAFLRTRAVSCAEPGEDGAADCSVAGQDIAGWLVENGWAEAERDGPLADMAEQARRDRRGIFGPDPRTVELAPSVLE